jgi:nitroimidazol reductase NimA-like FMN-containing flavoprotein (pyridoxamine 5'-phosphate oxidase superfamily)
MDAKLKEQILRILSVHRNMTLATVRPDGWPQATTVGYAHEGLTLYFLCGPESQKAANLAHDDRVSLTIGNDTDQVMEIEGVSMAAHARPIDDPAEVERVLGLIMARYPEQRGITVTAPPPSSVRIFRLTPVVISVLDYSKGFAHTELVRC